MKFEEILNKLLLNSMENRIDDLMESFRKEMIPELQAMFEQFQNNKSSSNNNNTEDEKYDENKNELKHKMHILQTKMEEMKEEKSKLEELVHDAASSKVGAILRLQNMIDHLRFDNSLLQKEVDYYKNYIDTQNTNNNSSTFGNIVTGIKNGIINVSFTNRSNIST